jgi:Flp pilus assembly protein TadG
VMRGRQLLTDPERGSGPAVSAAILMPLFALVLLAVAAGGRVSNAADATNQAARAAARIASIQRDPNLAETAATNAARATLDSKGLSCGTMTVAVDTDGLLRPLGQPATVTATVSCQVKLAALAFPGIPGDRTVTATFTSPVDPNRERS